MNYMALPIHVSVNKYRKDRDFTRIGHNETLSVLES